MNASDQFRQATAPESAADIDASAARWVVRSNEGLDTCAARELAHWRASDPRHEGAFQRLAAVSDALQRARRSGAAGAIAAELKARAGHRRHRRRALAGAGLAAILMLAAGRWMQSQRSELAMGQAPAAAANESIQRLPDGSLVELNGQSKIAVNFEPGFRRVELVQGEALFSVAKNPDRPFIVRANGVEVRAVGTAFNVRLEKTGVEVLVTEGKVKLEDAAHGSSLLARAADGEPGTLVAGQRARVEASRPGTAEVMPVAPGELAERLAWRRTRVEFSGIELAQAVDRINRSNRIQISLESAALGRLRLTGSFLSDDAETFSRLVAETFDLEAEKRDGGRIILKQPGRAAPGR